MLASAAVAAAVTAQGPLPDRDAFLKDVRANLARSQQLSHQYAYKERRTDLHMNPFGRMGMGDTRLIEVYPSPNPQLTYRRVIERNGQPVTRQDLEQQDHEYRLKASRVRRSLAREDDGDRRERERDEALARQRARMMIDDVVNVLQFDLARREMRDGVQTIVVTFSARPDARPLTREGRVARVFTGSAWVDEAAREVIHVEAIATDSVTFGGFIAKLYEGTEAALDRRQIEPGVWMPVSVKLGGQARALFRRTKIDYSVEWFDYRKLGDASFGSFGFNPGVEE
jgi:hypothetical protein